MSLTGTDHPNDKLISDLLASLDRLFGYHAGFRAVHAKGWICSGTFEPTTAARQLTVAPHVQRDQTPVYVRFSDFAGNPNVADNDPAASGPRGMAVRFMLAEHEHTDIIGHSTDSFPVRTGEEFLEFATALAASGPDVAKPTPFDRLLETRPKIKEFVEIPKPIPASFAQESYFAVTVFRFTNAKGAVQHGRFRLRPKAGNRYLRPEEAAAKSHEFLREELDERLSQGPIEFDVVVQIAKPGDELADCTVSWPADREEIHFGTLRLTAREDEEAPELRKIIFDPIPRVPGIDPAGDPLLEVRAAIYLMSGRRRRKANT